MLLQATFGVAVGSMGYLKYIGLSPLNLMDIAKGSGNEAIVAKIAGISTVVLAANFAEFLVYSGSSNGPIAKCVDFIRVAFGQEKRRGVVVNDWIEEYNRLHKSEDPTERNSAYSRLVNHYYELATLFYEIGWCPSFHFAYRMLGESFIESIRRHEYYLAGWLGLPPGSKVLDCGCGIGGPYRNIARFTKWDITGVTINEYQVKRGNQLSELQGLSKTCRSVQADFMKLPFDKESFDGVYAIEATCHAPERRGVYGEILRVLKPGGTFACYEWCLTDGYDKNNADHRRYKKQIEEGDGLPDICHTSEVNKALKDVGFEIVTYRDMVNDADQQSPWYITMTPSWNPFTQRFQFNWFGMFLTKWGLKFCEFLYLVPTGTSKIQVMLQQAALGLAGGGITGSFTPMYLVVARKPKK